MIVIVVRMVVVVVVVVVVVRMVVLRDLTRALALRPRVGVLPPPGKVGPLNGR